MNYYFIFLLFLNEKMNVHTLTKGEKIAILNEHNNQRRIVEPGAADMIKLKWNDTLEDLAQMWANRCQFEHPTSKDKDIYKFGQNLWQQNTKNPEGTDFVSSVASWASEKSRFTYPAMCTSECGHYRQVVHSMSYDLGCASQRCPRPEGEFGMLLVCQYEIGSNQGYMIYGEGKPCTECPKKFPVCEDKLCTTKAVTTKYGNGRFLLTFLSALSIYGRKNFLL